MTSCKPPPTRIDASPTPDANDSRMSAIPYEANLTPMGNSPRELDGGGRRFYRSEHQNLGGASLRLECSRPVSSRRDDDPRCLAHSRGPFLGTSWPRCGASCGTLDHVASRLTLIIGRFFQETFHADAQDQRGPRLHRSGWRG